MKFKKGTVFGLDFDGTCVTHDYPDIGKSIGAEKVLKRIVEASGRLVLNTMRSTEKLDEAVEWFKQNDIPLYGIQRNPTQDSWTSSPKVYAQIYIDDAALGCPLIENKWLSTRPYVNWKEVESMLFAENSHEQYKQIVKRTINKITEDYLFEMNTKERRLQLEEKLRTEVNLVNKNFGFADASDFYDLNQIGLIPLNKESTSSRLTFNAYTTRILSE